MNALSPNHTIEKPFKNLRRAIHQVTNSKIIVKSIIITLYSSVTTWSMLTLGVILLCKQGSEPKQNCIIDEMFQTNQQFWNSYCRGHVYDTAFNPAYEKLVMYPGVRGDPGEKYRKLALYYYFAETIITIAILFSLPQVFLKLIENNNASTTINNLITEIQQKLAEENESDTINKLIRRNIPTFTRNKYYTILAETGCFVALCFATYILDNQMTGLFISFGTDVIAYKWSHTQEQLVNPITFRFPSVAECTQKVPQPSRKIDENAILCYLAGNKLYGRITLIIYWWFCLLGTVSLINMAYQIILGLSTKLRVIKFNQRFNETWQGELNTTRRHIPKLTLVEFDTFLNLAKVLNPETVLVLLVNYTYDKADNPQNNKKFTESAI